MFLRHSTTIVRCYPSIRVNANTSVLKCINQSIVELQLIVALIHLLSLSLSIYLHYLFMNLS